MPITLLRQLSATPAPSEGPIEQLARKTGLSLRWIAELAGVPSSTLTRIRNGEIAMSDVVRERLATVPAKATAVHLAEAASALASAMSSCAASISPKVLEAWQNQADQLRAQARGLEITK